MRYLIISDIHGSPVYLEKVLDRFEKENFDFLVILGDVLYHGPRNPIPEGYDPKRVIALLNPLSDRILACRGNCDAEVDQMMLKFACGSDYISFTDGDITFFATHSHLYAPDQFPPAHFPKGPKQNVCLYGHSHVWQLEKQDQLVLCNPGSITLPKMDNPPTYAVYEHHTLSVVDFDNNILASLSLD